MFALTPATRISAPAQAEDPFGIYIHIPFCTHICLYCDFNTYSGQESRIEPYLEALRSEIEQWATPFRGREAGSIFFGGGTPSLLAGRQVSSVLAACHSAFDIPSDAEISFEANPNDISERYCTELLEAGVTRLSIGVQTLDRRGLRVLGRLHEGQHAVNAVKAARFAGFANLSLDFIYGWPGQTIDQWRHDLERVLGGDMGAPPEHLSLYGLIVEPGTPMADAVKRGIMRPADDDQSADLAELAQSMLAVHGWNHYEIANWHSSRGTPSRHNSLYWRNGDYAGIGAGAHGHIGNVRTMNQPSPQRYTELLADGQTPVTNTETFDERTAMGETMMLGLRLLDDGVSPAAFAKRHGIALEEQFGTEIATLRGLGLIDENPHSVRLTERGSMLANSVCAEFLQG